VGFVGFAIDRWPESNFAEASNPAPGTSFTSFGISGRGSDVAASASTCRKKPQPLHLGFSRKCPDQLVPRIPRGGEGTWVGCAR